MNPNDWKDSERIDALEARVDGWHPIATAPQDGSYVLVYNALGNVHVAHWARRFLGDQVSETWVCDTKQVAKPTHWMPLPDPPKT